MEDPVFGRRARHLTQEHPQPERDQAPLFPRRVDDAALLRAISGLSPEARIAAWGAALRAGLSASSEAAAALVQAAIVPNGVSALPRWLPFQKRIIMQERQRADAALAQVAGNWVVLSGPLRRVAAVIGQGRWQSQPITLLATSPDTRQRAGVAALAIESGDLDLADLAADLVGDRDRAVADAASHALLAMTMLWLSTRSELAEMIAPRMLAPALPPTDVPRGDVARLLNALARSAGAFASHERRSVLLAALLACDRVTLRRAEGAALATMLASALDPQVEAFKSVIRFSRVPLMRLRALELLGHPTLGRSASDRLARAKTVADHELTLNAAHLLVRPSRARACRGLKLASSTTAEGVLRLQADAAMPNAAVMGMLSITARRLAPMLVQAAGWNSRQSRAALEPLLTEPDPISRHAAVRRAPVRAIEDFLFDADERVAATAAWRWSTLGTGPVAARSERAAPVLAALEQSPHASVRFIAGEQRRREGASRVAAEDPSSRWSTLETPAARLATRRRLARTPQDVIDVLRAGVASKDLGEATQAAMQARRLGVVGALEKELIELIERAPRVAGTVARAPATAVAALGEAATPRASVALAFALEHPDARVRANAIDAALRLSRAASRPALGLDRLVELKLEPHHRVRASALRAILSGPAAVSLAAEQAAADLASMLTSSDASSRLAGSWLASRVLPGAGRQRLGRAWPVLLAQVEELARFDPEPKIRLRAGACAERLGREMQASWISRERLDQPPSLRLSREGAA